MKYALAWLALVAACDQAPPAANTTLHAPRRSLHPVAERRVAELEARVGPSAELREPDAEAQERVAGLLEVLAGTDERLRRLAREDLAAFGNAVVPVLAARLTRAEATPAARMAAAQVLGELDTRESAEALLRRLELSRTAVDLDSWLRAHCAWQLATGSQDWVVPRLLLHLRYETDHQTVIWLAATLAHFGIFAGLDALYTIARDARTQELRDAAASTIVELAADHGFDDGLALYRAWNDGDPDHRLPDAEFSPGRALEIWRIVRGFAEWQLRGVDDGRFVLQREHPRAAPLLAEALSDQNRYVRMHAAQALERMGRRARAAGPALLEALDDADVAPQAALSLGAVGHESAEGALIARLAPAYSLDLRVAAAKALGKLGLASSTPSLDALVDADEPLDLRIAAACACVLVSPGTVARSRIDLLSQQLASGEVESAGPEQALDAWLAHRASSSPAAKSLFEDWRRIAPEDPRQRVTERSALLRERLDALDGPH